MMHRGAAGATSQFDIRVGGQRLEAARWAGRTPHAPTILLLHEGLGCVALWRDFPARLAAATGLSVVAYSRAGYGASDPCPLPRPLDYMEQEARRLTEILNALGLDHHVLVGHSDGASIAALAAADSPPGLLGLALMAP
ncbi:MAG: alpha/beta fold hydrolase, partial [Pseudomonadota bacterium]